MEKHEEKGCLDGINNIKGWIVDFKNRLRKVYEVVCSSLRHNQELSTDSGVSFKQVILLGFMDKRHGHGYQGTWIYGFSFHLLSNLF